MKRLLKLTTITLVTLIIICISITISSKAIPNSYNVQIVGEQYLRDYPSYKANIIKQLSNGDIVTVTQEADGWLKVFDTTSIGYLPIVLHNSNEQTISIEESEKTYTMALTTSSLNIREAPDKESDSLIVIPKNALVIVHDSSLKTWWYIEYGGYIGYSHSDYLSWYDSGVINEIPIATYSTEFSTKKSQAGRIFNIEKAATLLNGYIIPHDTEFSMLNVIGPITSNAGYREAPEYKVKNGIAETVIGYGGGVCQVSTTLYNTFLCAHSKVSIDLLERHTHALPVSYVPDGMDATISYSSKKDFRFKNNSGFDLIIRTFVSDNGCISIFFTKK